MCATTLDIHIANINASTIQQSAEIIDLTVPGKTIASIITNNKNAII